MRFPDCIGESRPGVDRHFVNARCPILAGLMPESVWNFGGYILNQSSSEGDVQQLRSATDGKNRETHLASSFHECDLRMISRNVGFTAFRRSGLSIERRLYIFAAGEKQSVHAGKNYVYGFVTRQRRDDNWYEPCTLECIDIRIVEPDAMGISIGCIRGRRNRDDGGCRGSAI